MIFDCKTLVGKTLVEAHKLMEGTVYYTRIVCRDGRCSIGTRDVNPNRINVSIEDEKIFMARIG